MNTKHETSYRYRWHNDPTSQRVRNITKEQAGHSDSTRRDARKPQKCFGQAVLAWLTSSNTTKPGPDRRDFTSLDTSSYSFRPLSAQSFTTRSSFLQPFGYCWMLDRQSHVVFQADRIQAQSADPVHKFYFGDAACAKYKAGPYAILASPGYQTSFYTNVLVYLFRLCHRLLPCHPLTSLPRVTARAPHRPCHPLARIKPSRYLLIVTARIKIFCFVSATLICLYTIRLYNMRRQANIDGMPATTPVIAWMF